MVPEIHLNYARLVLFSIQCKWMSGTNSSFSSPIFLRPWCGHPRLTGSDISWVSANASCRWKRKLHRQFQFSSQYISTYMAQRLARMFQICIFGRHISNKQQNMHSNSNHTSILPRALGIQTFWTSSIIEQHCRTSNIMRDSRALEIQSTLFLPRRYLSGVSITSCKILQALITLIYTPFPRTSIRRV